MTTDGSRTPKFNVGDAVLLTEPRTVQACTWDDKQNGWVYLVAKRGYAPVEADEDMLTAGGTTGE